MTVRRAQLVRDPEDEQGFCIEVEACPEAVRVRDSKVLDGPQLALKPQAWAGFVSCARDDQAFSWRRGWPRGSSGSGRRSRAPAPPPWCGGGDLHGAPSTPTTTPYWTSAGCGAWWAQGPRRQVPAPHRLTVHGVLQPGGS
ncbi:DUF397 domain-containing protein [Streptomyces sp. NPDC056387]|uniref:DUF397 domain-containing protein n=1 Tax=Streptomyces sp. NPDC056387 TaxID=3345803 RepID=UPI0035DF64DB